jgi:hypothetical protein
MLLVNFVMTLPRYCDVSFPGYCGSIMAGFCQLFFAVSHEYLVGISSAAESSFF